MAFHTVLTPPVEPGGSTAEALEKAVFLKDGFVLSAFVFTGFWLLSKRLWLWAALFALVWAALVFGGPRLGLHPAALAVAQVLIGLFLGLEGNALVERKLLAQGWTLAGVVEGSRLDTVERRFFEHADLQPPRPSSVTAALARFGAGAPAAPAPQQPIGLFPDPYGPAR